LTGAKILTDGDDQVDGVVYDGVVYDGVVYDGVVYDGIDSSRTINEEVEMLMLQGPSHLCTNQPDIQ
jgi:hypothetical protein